MSDLEHGPGSHGDDASPPRRRGRRVRPGAVPDAPRDDTGELRARPTASFDAVVAGHDPDEVFDLEAVERSHRFAPRAVPAETPRGPRSTASVPEGPATRAVPVAEPEPRPEPRLEPEPQPQPEPQPEPDAYEEPYDEAYDEHLVVADYPDDGYDDLDDDSADAGSGRRGRRPRRGRGGRAAVVLLVCFALLGGAVYAGWSSFVSPLLERLEGDPPPEDFAGPGGEEVDVVVNAGDTGGQIGETLVEAGVVASRAAFVAAFQANADAAGLQPGTYRVRSEMKASDALALLLDPASRQSLRVALPEGRWVSETLAEISTDTGIPVEELQAALADPALGLPPEAGGSAEGYLFPATYDFDPDVTALEVLQAMVARHTQAMDELGVPAAQRRDVLVRASIVQGEASRADDMAKVARVVQNRLDRNETLGMDSTVGYIVQKRNLDLTASDLQTDSPYNTRVNRGLPPGPINNPGEDALAAALAPAEGDWLYFVTVDGDTGETVFTSDYNEFLAAKAQFQEWLEQNG